MLRLEAHCYMSDNNHELKQRERALEKRRDELLVEKQRHATQLSNIKQLVKDSGRMEDSKYRQCCQAQTRHVQAIAKIEGLLAPIKHELREIIVREFEDRQVSIEVRSVETLRLKQTVQALVTLRENYQRFAADHTRVSSMREMTAKFVLDLNEVIKLAISKPEKA